MKPTPVNYIKLWWHCLYNAHSMIEWGTVGIKRKIVAIFCGCGYGRELDDKRTHSN